MERNIAENSKENKKMNKEELEKKYKLIGKGKDGCVYQLTSTRCVKLFRKREIFEKELEVYLLWTILTFHSKSL